MVDRLLKGMADIDTPAYFASDAARAAGIDMPTLQNWLKRDAFGFTPHDRIGTGTGSRHLFTFRSVFILATTAEMVRNGITPQHAYGVARKCLGKGKIDVSAYILVFPSEKGFAHASADWLTIQKAFDELDLGDAASFLIIDPEKIKALITKRLNEGKPL
jgi:hypothetical protein